MMNEAYIIILPHEMHCSHLSLLVMIFLWNISLNYLQLCLTIVVMVCVYVTITWLHY